MNRLIYIFTLLLLSSNTTYGQNVEQWHSTNLDFYVGTWRYTNTTTKEEFTIKLRKSVYTAYDIRRDCVVGAYTYKKNGVVVLDNMNKYMNDRSVGNPVPIYASNARETAAESNPNMLRANIEDYGILWPGSTSFKSGEGVITIVSTGNPKKIHWALKDSEGPRIVGHHPPLGFTIPTDMILTKIE